MTPIPASKELLAQAVLNSGVLLKRYLTGFNNSNRCFVTIDLPNHPAWTLGHLALTMIRAGEKLGGPAPSPDHFVTADGKGGDDQRFDTESVAFGSTPSLDPTHFPNFDRCVEIFDHTSDSLVQTIRKADDEALARDVRWGSTTIPGWSVALRMAFHNGTHSGQLADLRRSLRFESIFA